jgi:hypothetical protein
LPEVAADEPRGTVIATDNDYGELELRRLTVNVDTQFIIHPDTVAEEAEPLADMLVGQLVRGVALRSAPDEDTAQAPLVDDPVARCLPDLVADSPTPLVPVFVELARFQGEEAVIFAFAAEEPQSGTYRRIEAWAVSRADCQVLGFAQYDRG